MHDKMPDEIWARVDDGQWFPNPRHPEEMTKYIRSDLAPVCDGKIEDAIKCVRGWMDMLVARLFRDYPLDTGIK